MATSLNTAMVGVCSREGDGSARFLASMLINERTAKKRKRLRSIASCRQEGQLHDICSWHHPHRLPDRQQSATHNAFRIRWNLTNVVMRMVWILPCLLQTSLANEMLTKAEFIARLNELSSSTVSTSSDTLIQVNQFASSSSSSSSSSSMVSSTSLSPPPRCVDSFRQADINNDLLLHFTEYPVAVEIYANRDDCEFGGTLLGSLFNVYACPDGCSTLVEETCCETVDIGKTETEEDLNVIFVSFCNLLDRVLELECPVVPLTEVPATAPSAVPTRIRTTEPTAKPSVSLITDSPTARPTKQPTSRPTNRPTDRPTHRLTSRPTKPPTRSPTRNPTAAPTLQPSIVSSISPTIAQDNQLPSESPSLFPSFPPMLGLQSDSPSLMPSIPPSITLQPTTPSNMPSKVPSKVPSEVPSELGSDMPSQTPSQTPTVPTALVTVTYPIGLRNQPNGEAPGEEEYFPELIEAMDVLAASILQEVLNESRQEVAVQSRTAKHHHSVHHQHPRPRIIINPPLDSEDGGRVRTRRKKEEHIQHRDLVWGGHQTSVESDATHDILVQQMQQERSTPTLLNDGDDDARSVRKRRIQQTTEPVPEVVIPTTIEDAENEACAVPTATQTCRSITAGVTLQNASDDIVSRFRSALIAAIENGDLASLFQSLFPDSNVVIGDVLAGTQAPTLVPSTAEPTSVANPPSIDREISSTGSDDFGVGSIIFIIFVSIGGLVLLGSICAVTVFLRQLNTVERRSDFGGADSQHQSQHDDSDPSRYSDPASEDSGNSPSNQAMYNPMAVSSGGGGGGGVDTGVPWQNRPQRNRNRPSQTTAAAATSTSTTAIPPSAATTGAAASGALPRPVRRQRQAPSEILRKETTDVVQATVPLAPGEYEDERRNVDDEYDRENWNVGGDGYHSIISSIGNSMDSSMSSSSHSELLKGSFGGDDDDDDDHDRDDNAHSSDDNDNYDNDDYNDDGYEYVPGPRVASPQRSYTGSPLRTSTPGSSMQSSAELTPSKTSLRSADSTIDSGGEMIMPLAGTASNKAKFRNKRAARKSGTYIFEDGTTTSSASLSGAEYYSDSGSTLFPSQKFAMQRGSSGDMSVGRKRSDSVDTATDIQLSKKVIYEGVDYMMSDDDEEGRAFLRQDSSESFIQQSRGDPSPPTSSQTMESEDLDTKPAAKEVFQDEILSMEASPVSSTKKGFEDESLEDDEIESLTDMQRNWSSDEGDDIDEAPASPSRNEEVTWQPSPQRLRPVSEESRSASEDLSGSGRLA